jgi:phosphoribosylanthranilate isomerase
MEQAAALFRGVPPFVARVGVFVNAGVAEVVEAVRQIGLDVVQLHGDESPADYTEVGAALLKAVALDTDHQIEAAAVWPEDVHALIDAADTVRRGGTGRQANWARAGQLAQRRPVVLAGGLDAANVADAVSAVRPWAVDVSSGVESAPGVKDRVRLVEFVAAVRRAGEAL